MVFERKKIFPSSSPSLSFWKVSISTSQRLESILEATSFEGLNDPTLCSEKKLSSGKADSFRDGGISGGDLSIDSFAFPL